MRHINEKPWFSSKPWAIIHEKKSVTVWLTGALFWGYGKFGLFTSGSPLASSVAVGSSFALWCSSYNVRARGARCEVSVVFSLAVFHYRWSAATQKPFHCEWVRSVQSAEAYKRTPKLNNRLLSFSVTNVAQMRSFMLSLPKWPFLWILWSCLALKGPALLTHYLIKMLWHTCLPLMLLLTFRYLLKLIEQEFFSFSENYAFPFQLITGLFMICNFICYFVYYFHALLFFEYLSIDYFMLCNSWV